MAYDRTTLRRFVEHLIQRSETIPELGELASEEFAFENGVETALNRIWNGKEPDILSADTTIKNLFGLDAAGNVIRYIALLWATHAVIRSKLPQDWKAELIRRGIPENEAATIVDLFMSDLAKLLDKS